MRQSCRPFFQLVDWIAIQLFEQRVPFGQQLIGKVTVEENLGVRSKYANERNASRHLIAENDVRRLLEAQVDGGDDHAQIGEERVELVEHRPRQPIAHYLYF
jgi:hypothetical protein